MLPVVRAGLLEEVKLRAWVQFRLFECSTQPLAEIALAARADLQHLSRPPPRLQRHYAATALLAWVVLAVHVGPRDEETLPNCPLPRQFEKTTESLDETPELACAGLQKMAESPFGVALLTACVCLQGLVKQSVWKLRQCFQKLRQWLA